MSYNISCVYKHRKKMEEYYDQSQRRERGFQQEVGAFSSLEASW